MFFCYSWVVWRMLWNTVNWTSSLQLRKQKMVSKNLPVARLVLHVCPPLPSSLCTAGKVQKSKQPSVLEPKKSYNIGELFLLLAVRTYLYQAIHGRFFLLLFLLHLLQASSWDTWNCHLREFVRPSWHVMTQYCQSSTLDSWRLSLPTRRR